MPERRRLGVIVAIGLIWLVVSLAALWKIFVKMGEPGWKGIIPILHASTSSSPGPGLDGG